MVNNKDVKWQLRIPSREDSEEQGHKQEDKSPTLVFMLDNSSEHISKQM